MRPPPALLTGATGFVGSALARELARRGHEIHALVRATSDRAALAGLDVRWHEGDLCDAPSVARAVEAAGREGEPPWVLHSGAVISYRTRDRDLQRAVNVDGTRHVLEACRRHGARRLLHVSSVVAVGVAKKGELLDEDSPYTSAALGSDYMDTKREAEELATDAAADIDLVIVNPGAIFGPGSRGPNTVKLLQRIERGIGPFAPPGTLSPVGLADVVDGSLRALERGARGRRYILTERSLPVLELMSLCAAALGAKAPRWSLPRPLWTAAVASAALLDRLAPSDLFTPQALRLVGCHFAYDSSRARRELGWNPRPFEEVLAETVAWLRARGALAG